MNLKITSSTNISVNFNLKNFKNQIYILYLFISKLLYCLYDIRKINF